MISKDPYSSNILQEIKPTSSIQKNKQGILKTKTKTKLSWNPPIPSNNMKFALILDS